MAILAFLAFVFAVVFHGLRISPDLWFGWQGLALLGFVFLTLEPAWGRLETYRTRRTVVVPPQQP